MAGDFDEDGVIDDSALVAQSADGKFRIRVSLNAQSAGSVWFTSSQTEDLASVAGRVIVGDFDGE